MKKPYKSGWHGDSRGHSLAARGISMYAKKKMVDPVFYARKAERKLPFSHIMSMVGNGQSFQEMQRMHPDVDTEDLRKRAIRATEIRMADDTIAKLDEQGVDVSVAKAESSKSFKKSAKSILNSNVHRSLLKDEKAKALQERIQ
jgi:hypothetical protein